MPGEYLKGFPDPPNSPNEKFLLPSTPHLWQDDLYRDLINNGAPHELALAISRSIAQHEDRKALVEQHAQKQLEWWANIHTHPGGTSDLPSGLMPKEEAHLVATGNSSSTSSRLFSVDWWGAQIDNLPTGEVFGANNIFNMTWHPGGFLVVATGGSNSRIARIDLNPNGTFPSSPKQWDVAEDYVFAIATRGQDIFVLTRYRLYKIDEDNNEIWSTSLPASLQLWGNNRSIALVEGMVAYNDEVQGEVRFYSQSNGAFVDSVETTGICLSTVSSANGKIYTGGERLYCIDPSTFTIEHQSDPIVTSSRFLTACMFSNKILFALDQDANFWAWDTEEEEFIFSDENNPAWDPYGPVADPHNRLYTPGSGSWYAFNFPDITTEEWQFSGGANRSFVSFTGPQGHFPQNWGA